MKESTKKAGVAVAVATGVTAAALMLSDPEAPAPTPSFVPDEVAELGKLFHAYDQGAARAADRIARSMEDFGTEADRQDHASALLNLALYGHSMHRAIALLQNAPNRINGNDTREQTVVDAFSALDGANTNLERARDRLTAIPQNRNRDAALAAVANAMGNLASFDRTLSYVDHQLPGFPAVIFPHGDQPRVAHDFARFGRYGTGHVPWDLAMLYDTTATPVFPDAARRPCRMMIQFSADMLNKFVRSWAMSMRYEFPEDKVVIDREFADAPHSRPRPFFVEEHIVRISTGDRKSGVINVTSGGTQIEDGAAQHIFDMMTFQLGCVGALQGPNDQAVKDRQVAELLELDVVDEASVRAAYQRNPLWSESCFAMQPQNDSLGERAPEGVCTNFPQDIGDAWKNWPDGWLHSMLDRFHGPFGPPPGGGDPTTTIPPDPPDCPSFDMALEVIGDETVAVCREVPDSQ